jgi:hypothetical protein
MKKNMLQQTLAPARRQLRQAERRHDAIPHIGIANRRATIYNGESVPSPAPTLAGRAPEEERERCLGVEGGCQVGRGERMRSVPFGVHMYAHHHTEHKLNYILIWYRKCSCFSITMVKFREW